MKTKFLLPNSFKKIGWVLFFPSLTLGIITLIYSPEPEFFTMRVPALFNGDITIGNSEDDHFKLLGFIKTNVFNELAAIMVLISSMLVMYSREKGEDEFIMKLRLESILWSALIYGIIVFIGIALIYDFGFIHFMSINMFLLFLLFIGRFHWVLWKYRKEADDKYS